MVFYLRTVFPVIFLILTFLQSLNPAKRREKKREQVSIRRKCHSIYKLNEDVGREKFEFHYYNARMPFGILRVCARHVSRTSGHLESPSHKNQNKGRYNNLFILFCQDFCLCKKGPLGFIHSSDWMIGFLGSIVQWSSKELSTVSITSTDNALPVLPILNLGYFFG